MKGWRPSACPLVRNRFGLGEAGEFLPDVGSIGLSFARVPGPWAYDPGIGPWTALPFFAFMRLRGRQVGRRAPERPRQEKGVSPSLACMNSGRNRNEDQGADDQPRGQ